MYKDMTVGKPLKSILAFFVPMLFSTLFQQLYNITDMVIVGRFISKDAFAAVGATSSTNWMITSFIIGFVTGASVLISREFGNKSKRGVKSSIVNGIFVVAIVGLTITVLAAVFMNGILHLLRIPTEIYGLTYTYFITIVLGYPISVALNFVDSVMRAYGDSKSSMTRSIISTFVNITMDLVFVIVFKLGVFGVAIATVAAQIISLSIALAMYKHNYPEYCLKKEDFTLSRRIIGKVFSIGMPMGLQSSITAIGCTIMQSAVNSLGTNYVAAYSSASKIQVLITTPVSTLTTSLTPFVAQNYGAGKSNRILSGARKVFIIVLIYGFVGGLCQMFLGKYMGLMYLKSTETATLSLLDYYCKICGPFYILLSLLYFIRAYIQSLGQSVFTAIGGVVELMTRLVIALTLVNRFGFTIICFSEPIAWILTTSYLFAVYFIFVRKKIKLLGVHQHDEQLE
ncbi:MAG: MATE family efflux transporter [Acutalibacteraceae bacterium]